jgi:hypothetical protein
MTKGEGGSVAASTQSVVIPLSVLYMNGTPITDLTRENVSVFVDGVETPVTGFEKSTELPNIILLLETSVPLPICASRRSVSRQKLLSKPCRPVRKC